MSTAAARDRRDHDTRLPAAGAAAAIVLLAALAAQFSPRQAAAQNAPCTAIADDAERLACYDRALREATPAAPAPAAAAPAVPPPQAPTTNAAPAPTAAATAPSQDPDKAIVPIVIVGVRALPGRETIFTAQDGATWIQTDSQRVVGLPDTPFDAELKPGAMGSKFLVPKDAPRAIRVRRAER